MRGLKRSRGDEDLVLEIKSPAWHHDVSDLPESTARHNQPIDPSTPTLTAIDSSDDGHKSTNPRLATAGQSPAHRPGLDPGLGSMMTNPRSHIAGRDGRSPWSTDVHRDENVRFSSRIHDPAHRSLNISSPTMPLGVEYLLQSAAMNQTINTNCIGEKVSPSDKSILANTPRFPSPISDDDMGLGSEERTSGRIDKTLKQSTDSAPEVDMGYRADCEKCRCREPGHYVHIRF